MNIAVIWFPGTNCEEETKRAVEAAGMTATIVRWNDHAELSTYDGYVIPGGWSYEDRIRAGAIAAHDTIMKIIRKEAAAGKPVLGICNGCQVLAEAGMVPDYGIEPVEIALAPNENPFVSGYYCTHAYVKVKKKTAFTMLYEQNYVFKIPVAHGEGRFTTANEKVKLRLRENCVLAYCTKEGDEKGEFPTNPNGALFNMAGISNNGGNVVALMPHPERCAWEHQAGSMANADGKTPGILVFQSMKRYIEHGRTIR